jgi:methylenetetrahydrofolate dehydrogenase (NADP+)/methenyltetrahydrofolate cyclohydrolase
MVRVTAKLIDGRAIAASIDAEVARDVEALKREGAVQLVAVSVGDDAGASGLYLRSQRNACLRAGIRYRTDGLPAGTTQDDLHSHLWSLASDPLVTGVILQLPLPSGLSQRAAQDAILPTKDVEGVHRENVGRVTGGRALLAPCTALASVRLLLDAGVVLRGADCVVVGHSEIVGKPVAMLLLDQFATVTVCHIATRDLAAHTRRADVVVVAVGKPGLIRGDMLRPGAAVVDVGINVLRDGRVVGDCSPDVAEVAGLLTPVPGGVGPVTVSMLLRNTVVAARMQRGIG